MIYGRGLLRIYHVLVFLHYVQTVAGCLLTATFIFLLLFRKF